MESISQYINDVNQLEELEERVNNHELTSEELLDEALSEYSNNEKSFKFAAFLTATIGLSNFSTSDVNKDGNIDANAIQGGVELVSALILYSIARGVRKKIKSMKEYQKIKGILDS